MKILRYLVPIVDTPGWIELPGQVVHIAWRNARDIDVWVISPGQEDRVQLVVDHTHFPDDSEYIGTVHHPENLQVYHLIRAIESR